jgi:hypothetical protein
VIFPGRPSTVLLPSLNGNILAGSYFRKWFNEGKHVNLFTYRALLAAMRAMDNILMLLKRLLTGALD